MDTKTSKTLSIIAGSIIFIAFFMPWLGSNASAWDMVKELFSLFKNIKRLPDDIRVYLPFVLIALPICSTIVIINNSKTLNIDYDNTQSAKVITIIVFILVIITLIYLQSQNPFSEFTSIFKMLGIGFYLTLIGAVYYLVDMLANKKESIKSNSSIVQNYISCKNCGKQYIANTVGEFCINCGSILSKGYNIDPKVFAKKTVFEDKLKTDPLNVEILHEYAQFLFNNLLYKEVIPVALKTLAINEDDELSQILLFKSYAKLNMYKEAKEISNQLLTGNVTDVLFLEELANIETHFGNITQAIIHYETILKIEPTNKKARYRKAILFLENKELEEAGNIFRELYTDGERDRLTKIYAGVDKCLLGNYEKAIEILDPCLSEEDASFSDLNAQRAILYLIYCYCKTQNKLIVIDKWFHKIDFVLLKENLNAMDEKILGEEVLDIINIYIAIDSEKRIYVIDKYIAASSICITKNNHKYFAEAWFKISEVQVSSNLLADAQASLKKAIELSPENIEYKDKLKHVTALLEKKNKQQKRKTRVIIGSLIILVLLILISVFFYGHHKENIAWKFALQENNLNEYQNYLHKYPKGRYTEMARDKFIFIDERDGEKYKIVLLGKKIWMAENLRYLPSVVGSGKGSETTPYYYVNDYEGTVLADAKATSNYTTYGVLYNWPAAINACPTGWHLPSDAEWTELTNYLGGESVAGGKLKETGTIHWNSPNTGATNESGFSALPGGYRLEDGTYADTGIEGDWWSSTEYSTKHAYILRMFHFINEVNKNYASNECGFSIRCVKD